MSSPDSLRELPAVDALASDRQSRMRKRPWTYRVLFLLVGNLLASTWSAAAAGVTLTDDRGRQVELPAAPQRVVSLLPSLTEIVCALQACGRLVAVDRYADWPEAVRAQTISVSDGSSETTRCGAAGNST